MKQGEHSSFFTFSFLTILMGLPVQAWTQSAEDFGFELRNKVTAQILVDVSSLADGSVAYTYEIRSSSASIQSIATFALQLDVSISSANVVSPSGWESLGCCVTDTRRTAKTGIKAIEWGPTADDRFIRPGASSGGFKLTAKSLPAPKLFYVEGYTRNDIPEGEPTEEETQVLIDLQDPFNNSFSGQTLGADPIPLVIDIASLIGRLISLKHQSVSLGWIFGPGSDGIVKSLDAKLDAAKAAVARGQNKAASNQLNAFINELNALRGKKLNENAFFLLKVNAEFILSKLGP